MKRVAPFQPTTASRLRVPYPQVLALLLAVGTLHAEDASTAPRPVDAAAAGMSAARLAAIVDRMGEFVEEGQISGAVTLVARKGVLAHLESVGLADVGSVKP